MAITEESLRAAWEEAEIYCSNETIYIAALEIMHKTFEVPARVVQWSAALPEPRIFQCRLEDTAPYSPGEIVDFVGMPFELTWPEKSDSTPGSLGLKISGVGNRLDADLEAAAMSGGRIEGIIRLYEYGNEAAGPVREPFFFDVQEPSLDPATRDLVATGVVFSFMNTGFGRMYAPNDYPGLVNQ
jgi:hypothetical protein